MPPRITLQLLRIQGDFGLFRATTVLPYWLATVEKTVLAQTLWEGIVQDVTEEIIVKK